MWAVAHARRTHLPPAIGSQKWPDFNADWWKQRAVEEHTACAQRQQRGRLFTSLGNLPLHLLTLGSWQRMPGPPAASSMYS